MVTNGTHSAHQSMMACDDRSQRLVGITLPVGVAGGAYLLDVNPTQAFIDDPSPATAEAYSDKLVDALTADFMALAGSHMATTKVLARLVGAARRYVAEPSAVREDSLMEAIHAAEKDLRL